MREAHRIRVKGRSVALTALVSEGLIPHPGAFAVGPRGSARMEDPV
jgi:hypothetical protein